MSFFGFCEFYEYLKFQRHSVSPLTFWGRFITEIGQCIDVVGLFVFLLWGGGGMPS